MARTALLRHRLLHTPGLLAWILWHIVRSTFEIAREAFTAGPVGTPCLVRYPMRSRTDLEVTALAWAITVTPGTLTVAIGETDMWVHVVCGGPREAMTTMLAEVEDRVLSVLRGRAPNTSPPQSPTPIAETEDPQ